MSAPQSAMVMQAALARRKADPLAYWQTASREQETAIAELGRGEILYGGANKAGKTTFAYPFVALARGLRSIAGINLPSVPQPSSWVVASLDFTQQQLSVQPKYLRAVGTWPHKALWDRDTLRSLRVKYEGCQSDDPKDWSLITFISAKNQQAGTGFRGNGYHCDEPPPMWLLSELRKMGDAGQLVIGIITATMLRRSQWQPLRQDYPEPTRNEGRWVGRFLRLRAPAFNPDDLDDSTVGNRFLTRADKEDMLAKYQNDPTFEARILGREIDTSGSNPLRAVLAEMQRQHDAAREGVLTEWKVAREVPTREGKQLVTELVEVESWEDGPRDSSRYRIYVDTSLGLADGAHDPGMVQVVDMTARAQVCRYEGFIGEYGLGVLAGGLSKRWNDAEVKVATTGGYGEACLSGLRAVGCRNIFTTQVTSRTGAIDRTDIGWKETADTRLEGFAALREAFVAASAGHPYLTIRSRADLAQLIDLQIDGKDRIIRIAGVHHGESAVLLGRWAADVSPDKRQRSVPERARERAGSPAELMARSAGMPLSRSTGRAMPKQRLRYRH